MEYKTRKIIVPRNLNHSGTLFGGQALSWIDEEAAIYSACQMKSTKLVTAHMSEVDFVAPGHPGDIVEIGVETVKVGTTSLTVRCELRNMTTEKLIVVVEKIVFVNVDENLNPTPHGIKR